MLRGPKFTPGPLRFFARRMLAMLGPEDSVLFGACNSKKTRTTKFLRVHAGHIHWFSGGSGTRYVNGNGEVLCGACKLNEIEHMQGTIQTLRLPGIKEM